MSEYIVNMSGDWANKQGEKLTEIVRCRDCKYGIDGGEYCAEGCADSWDWRNVEPDGFCAWGKRKEGRRSMLTAQVDELREAAVICNLSGERETAKLLREAVYTIESLRDRLQAATLEERKDDGE